MNSKWSLFRTVSRMPAVMKFNYTGLISIQDWPTRFISFFFWKNEMSISFWGRTSAKSFLNRCLTSRPTRTDKIERNTAGTWLMFVFEVFEVFEVLEVFENWRSLGTGRKERHDTKPQTSRISDIVGYRWMSFVSFVCYWWVAGSLRLCWRALDQSWARLSTSWNHLPCRTIYSC